MRLSASASRSKPTPAATSVRRPSLGSYIKRSLAAMTGRGEREDLTLTKDEQRFGQ